MKEATLTSTHVVEKSTKSVDYSPIYRKVSQFAVSVANIIASEQFATVSAIAGALGVWVGAVAARPGLLTVSTIVAMAAILRITIPMTKGGEL